MEDEFYVTGCSFIGWLKVIDYLKDQGYSLSYDAWQTGNALFKRKDVEVK